MFSAETEALNVFSSNWLSQAGKTIFTEFCYEKTFLLGGQTRQAKLLLQLPHLQCPTLNVNPTCIFMEMSSQFLSSEQLCELKSVDVAFNIAVIEHNGWNTCCCSQHWRLFD